MKNLELEKMIIKRVIFVTLFFMIAVGIMAYCVVYNLPKNKEEIKIGKENNVESVSEKSLDLDGFYDINDIEIKKYKEDYQNLEINYYQIDGLKDNSVEVAINYNLKNDIETAIDKALSEEKINKDSFYLMYNINSNFANTLSVTYSFYSYRDIGEDEVEEICDETICENFDLVTGKKIKLNDIFTANAPIGKIFSSEMYENTLFNIADLEFNDDYWYEVKNYNDIEEEIFKVVSNYKSRKNINFYFDEQRVVLMDYGAIILYKDYADYIAIYDRYLSNESIFDGSVSNLKGLHVLEKRFNSVYQQIEKGTNYYIDASIANGYNDEQVDEEVFKKAKEILKDELNKSKQMIQENNIDFLVINCSIDIRKDGFYNEETQQYEDYPDRYMINITKDEYETTKELFDNRVYDEIIRVFIDYPEEPTGDVYCYNNMFMYYWPYNNYSHDERTVYMDDGVVIEDSDTMTPWDVTD